MAEILPFRALRYDLERVSPPDVVTEPYDKITPWMRQDYERRSPYSYSRLILPEGDGGERYETAAARIAEWRAEGILKVEDTPAFYMYRQRYASPLGGPERTRTALIGALRLEPPGEGMVFPHEQTLAAPREDRLRLLRATGHHLGQIFLLASPGDALTEAIRHAPSEPLCDFEWERETRHDLRMIREPDALRAIVAAAAPIRLVIADGHHRYETALAFSRETGLPGATHVMVTIVPAEDEGLIVLATHRVVKSAAVGTTEGLIERASHWFRIQPAAGLSQMLDQLAVPGHRTGFVEKSGAFSCWELRDDADLDELFDGYPAAWRRLDVAVLHAVALHRLLDIDTREPAGQQAIEYVRDPAEAEYRVREGDGACAFFIHPTPVQAVLDVALGGTRMPQKSTDFYPKIPSGLTAYDCARAPETPGA